MSPILSTAISYGMCQLKPLYANSFILKVREGLQALQSTLCWTVAVISGSKQIHQVSAIIDSPNVVGKAAANSMQLDGCKSCSEHLPVATHVSMATWLVPVQSGKGTLRGDCLAPILALETDRTELHYCTDQAEWQK